MELLWLIIYFAIGISTNIFDHFIVRAFHPDVHQDIYHFMADYAVIAEIVVYLMLLAIGIFTECGGIHSIKPKTAWQNAVTVFMTIGILESLARLHSMLVLAGHVHPGKIDFVGLFVVMVVAYHLLQFFALQQMGSGLYDFIESKGKPKPVAFSYEPVVMTPQYLQ